MIKVKIKKVSEDAKLPIMATEGAACYDVYAKTIEFKQSKVVIGLGFMTEIPEGYRGVLVPRSNLTKYHWVMNNSIGIIDSDYRGEWLMVFTPLANEVFPYIVGDRVGQMFFEKNLSFWFEEVEKLEDSVRQSGGFGSTGLVNLYHPTKNI